MSGERESAVNCLCIRYHLDCLTSDGHEEILKVFKDNSCKWFYGVHSTERPHVHWYLETKKNAQAVRSMIVRLRKHNNVGDRWYSVSKLRDSLTAYGSYVMLKPETTESDMYHITEDEVYAMIEYSKQFENIPKEQKKSKSVIALLQEYCKYDCNGSIAVNFNKMYDFLVDQGLYNMYTAMKMKQLFGMWKAKEDRKNNPMEYERVRREWLLASIPAFFGERPENF